MYRNIYLRSSYDPTYRSVHLSIYLSISLSIYRSIYRSIDLSICQSLTVFFSHSLPPFFPLFISFYFFFCSSLRAVVCISSYFLPISFYLSAFRLLCYPLSLFCWVITRLRLLAIYEILLSLEFLFLRISYLTDTMIYALLTSPFLTFPLSGFCRIVEKCRFFLISKSSNIFRLMLIYSQLLFRYLTNHCVLFRNRPTLLTRKSG